MQELINARVHDYYWKDDFSCAVTTLKILSEIYNLELQPQVIEAVFGLNAGRCGLQCGLVEGTLLFIGMYGRKKQTDNTAVVALCRLFCQEFQEQFGSMLCSQLRPEGFSPSNPPHLCEQLTKQAVLFSMEFIEKNIGK
ncbi:C-GCAxxG-C-C family protein [Sporomusa acidovorans]|uniref:Redox-active protein n=1 Tax=Sporomusa acidovorans (strain ATCC 49682 / DSM 3132 / Mol) TaxID=1123286 RepID=A0ABZ3J8Y0_SPOA4|nr:C-GCAxxG-C-C family protein [Sporomusa acidovorans]OZC16188.1 putative redox-active protein [Sporomusa acidovorans DSM 3132]SDE30432.1 C_GCAxxG_C_C family probable redox protein [Sporomusa acidovorans]